MDKIVYYSKPIGKEKIILELTTFKEEKKEVKRKQKVKLTKLEERNKLVNMNDPYWQWYFKK